ncbi:MAG: biopolymer transporter ExbD [candidate division Zixibacteria bacterium]|nr:biopolymer transporter ExbD [candidate division Zixibacteria bacterium]MDD5426227.1 biopolymer transporter ExbD [candidate division Zixibacteria bacterium]
MAMKKKRRIGIKIDMTPMVDIAFLLLIFYMSTTQFKPPEARAVELPSSHSMIELPDKDIINITVTKYDSIYVDYLQKIVVNIDGADVNTTGRVVRICDKYNVSAEINKARAKNLKALIVIKADRRATFGVMQDVMKSMQENHLERFLIITDHEVETGDKESTPTS